MRRWKLPLSPYKGKWQQTFGELQAMETLKKKILLEEHNPTTNFLSILTDTFHTFGLHPCPSAYSFVIKFLFRRNFFSEIPMILDHLEKAAETFQVSERIFVSLIKNYAKAGLVQDSVDIFFRIPRFRCTPSVLTLNSLLSVLCKKKEGLLFVRDVLVKTPQMNIRLEASSFRILIRALCRNGRVDFAVELLNMMQLNECTPDGRLYSLVLCSLCEQAGSVEIMGFLEEMRKAGFLPSVVEYNVVINALIRERRVYDAGSMLAQMKSEGIRPDTVSYNNILAGFVSASDFHMVDELFDEMLLMGLVPDIVSYNTYVDGLCRQGGYEQAQRMIVFMERTGCKPNIETFNMLIGGYSRAGELEKVREGICEMIKKGVQPNTYTFRILVDVLLCEGHIAEVCHLFMELLSKGFTPQLPVFEALMCGLCQGGLHGEALQVLDEMADRSLAPSANTWRVLLDRLKLHCEKASIVLEDIVEKSS